MVVATTICGCAVQPPGDYVETKAGFAATNVDACKLVITKSAPAADHALQQGRLGLLNWNVRKGADASWKSDLHALATEQDIVVLQEFAAGDEMARLSEFAPYLSFSRGYSTRNQTTGVATFSRVAPVAECHLIAIEPILRTPKAINITEFGIADSDDTLLVINIHAVNLSVGLIRFRAQMQQIRDVLSVHDGPAIMTGDFNTWRNARLKIVKALADEHAFAAVDFESDHRKHFNGYPLDHVFVRGLSVDQGQTYPVNSSDHNPISVELHL